MSPAKKSHVQKNPQSDREAAAAWLRSHNEDDVRATIAARNYLPQLSEEIWMTQN